MPKRVIVGIDSAAALAAAFAAAAVAAIKQERASERARELLFLLRTRRAFQQSPPPPPLGLLHKRRQTNGRNRAARVKKVACAQNTPRRILSVRAQVANIRLQPFYNRNAPMIAAHQKLAAACIEILRFNK